MSPAHSPITSGHEDSRYEPILVSAEDAESILDSGDVSLLMQLPDAWFEDGNHSHLVRVNPIAAGLRSVERGVADLRTLKLHLHRDARQIKSEFLEQMEDIESDLLELIDFQIGQVDFDRASDRIVLLRNAAGELKTTLPQLLAAMLGRTLQ